MSKSVVASRSNNVEMQITFHKCILQKKKKCSESSDVHFALQCISATFVYAIIKGCRLCLFFFAIISWNTTKYHFKAEIKPVNKKERRLYGAGQSREVNRHITSHSSSFTWVQIVNYTKVHQFSLHSTKYLHIFIWNPGKVIHSVIAFYTFEMHWEGLLWWVFGTFIL